MSYGSIYKIEFPNGKHYIGLTSRTLEQRTKEHRYSAKCENTQYIYKALRKYDMVDTFELIEIDTAETKEELCELEVGYILMYNSYMDENGYNMTFGGEGFNGYVYTEDVKQKMSESRKKFFIENPDRGKELGEKIKKYHRDNPTAGKEHGEKIKKYHKANPTAGQKISEAFKNRSPEWKIKRLDVLGKNKPFDIFTIDGTFVKTFNYQFEAIKYLQQEYHIEKTLKIDEVLAGKRNNSAGFIFTYK
jgi:group I intron endonuclease